jgi:hypothetical protein
MLALTIEGQTTYLDDEKSDSAMRRYWRAKSRGDNTAKLERLDGPPPVQAGSISMTAQQRISQHEDWLAEAGFAVKPPLYAPGTRVLAEGDKRFRLERKRVEELPSFLQVGEAIIDTIRSENREDFTFNSKDIAMVSNGTIQVRGEQWGLEPSAFRQLATLNGFGGGTRYLTKDCAPGLRAHNVNAQLARNDGRKIVLRTRETRDARQVYAVVTPTYSALDTHRVLKKLIPAVGEAKTEARYDGSGVRATALWMPDQVSDLAAGDIFKVGVRVETDDTGQGRIRIHGVVYRNRCLNLILIDSATVETASAVHRGNPAKLMRKVVAGVGKARESVSKFISAWEKARHTPVDAPSKLRQWLKERRIELPGRRNEEQQAADLGVLLAAWDHEPGHTLADAVNAVTRAAHSHDGWDQLTRESLERQAARLVLVPR